MLNLTWIQTLVVLMKKASFQGAAKELGLAQPTVTQHIQKLEEYLGTHLIQRGRHSCLPTEAANRLLPYAESLLRLNQLAVASVQNNNIRIGASSNIGIYLLQPELSAYIRHFPDIGVAVEIESNPTIAEKLMNAEIDIAIMEWWIPKAGVKSIVWKNEPLVLITPVDHPLSSLPSLDKETLADLSLIGGEPGTGTGRILRAYLQDTGKTPQVSMQLGSTEAVKRAVMAGLGISLVFASAVEDEAKQQKLCAIPLSDHSLSKPIQIVWRESRHTQQAIPAFIEHLMESGKNHPPHFFT
jgi:DNA-binding transcriptional LysR family regulator